jgi:[ribosomal protein S18]-alanine N-acetyltransferase
MKKLPASVRPASVDDIDAVAKIDAQSNRPPWSPSAFSAELTKPHSWFWVLTDDETDTQILGFFVASAPDRQVHLQTFAVNSKERRKGYGRHLLQQLIHFAIRRKMESLILEVRKSNEPALQLYQSLGFVVIRVQEGLYPDGEDGYVLILKLEERTRTTSAEDQFSEPGAETEENGNRPKNYH